MPLLSPLEKHLNRCYRRGGLVLERTGDIKVKKDWTLFIQNSLDPPAQSTSKRRFKLT